MSQKVFRDPLYNYIAVNQKRDGWLQRAIDSREMQRLRRIHQLGVSNFTYPGADHSRLCHSLGVLHLMQLTLDHLSQKNSEEEFLRARAVMLGAALCHDVGHGPFSHLFEPCLGIDHEYWSKRIILNPKGELNRALKSCDSYLPEQIANLIDPSDQKSRPWQKYLISSQLDMDRIDYLRRDSFFTGAGYGHFDWHRLITTMEMQGDTPENWEVVWNEKAKFAIEEYIFSRYYMYQNVYLHKTTRGFEQILQAMWKRARELRDGGISVQVVQAIDDYWKAGEENATEEQYLSIEEFTVLQQIQIWMQHPDPGLSDLASRFLNRKPFAMVEAPQIEMTLESTFADWEHSLKSLVESRKAFQPSWMYCLIDNVKPKYHQPYFPERESDEQSVKNAIRIVCDDASTIEISQLLPRLRPITKYVATRRYYIPQELKKEALKLKADFEKKSKP